MIDFPSNPVDGQTVTSGRKTWQWVALTGTWDLVSTPGYAYRVLGADPATPDDGDAWIRSDLMPPEFRVRTNGATYKLPMAAA